MSGATRFQSRIVLGKNDIFLVSIREKMAETETDTIKKNSSSMMHQKKKESYLIIY
jgi:hypothetical protein